MQGLLLSPEELFAEQIELADSLSGRPHDAVVIEGYPVLWDQIDLQRATFRRGAFLESLKLSQGARGVLMHHQHVERRPIGRWSILREDDRGLYARGALYPVFAGRPLIRAVMDCSIRGLSPGFYGQHERVKFFGGKTILRALLSEVSIGQNPVLTTATFRVVER